MKVTVAAVALCLAQGAVARPQDAAPARGGKKFTLNQMRNERFRGHDVPTAFVRAHLKYGKGLPENMSMAMQVYSRLLIPDDASKLKDGGQTGSVQADAPADFDSEYVVPVAIGTPPQTLPLNLDTGSADFWTFSTDTYRPLVRGQTLYRPRASSTSSLLRGQSWQIRYGDGSGASGIVYTDRVRIGDTSVADQAVQAAVQVSEDISYDSFASGILGMAHSSANTVRPMPQRTYFDRVKDDLAQPLFTANLHRHRAGNYNFGFVDASEHTGSIAYAPIDPMSPFWKVAMGGYQVGAKRYDDYAWDGVVDTGTSLLLVPDAMVGEYYRQVPGAGLDRRVGMTVVPCSARLPDFYFGIGSYRGRVPGAYMNYGHVNDSHCYGGIQSSQGIGVAVLGDVLLKAQFVVFDGGRAAVGFANKQLEA